MPLQNLNENYFYHELPKFVVDLDTRKLIQAVIGGYQDRVEDLRTYAGWFDQLNTAQPAPMMVVLASYMGDAGNTITRTLNVQDDTPDEPTALLAWAATQMGVNPTRMLSAVAGTDLLRTVSIDTVQLLAQSLGATLYAGPATDTPAEATAREQRVLASYFPRLKTKGTANSFAQIAKLSGFDDATMTPLWGRLSPRVASDAGDPNNDQDFAAVPDYTPSAQLPDPTGDYDPQNFSDGVFYQYTSPLLVPDPEANEYYPSAVNGANPFINLVQVASTIANPATGTYTLSGGAPELQAQVSLDNGTVITGLLAQAIAPGASFNGLPITVLNIGTTGAVVSAGGTAGIISIYGALSSIKYRTSYFDLGVYTLNPGTIATVPNTDLINNPTLVWAAGTAPAPWRPWANGWQQQPSVVLWPEKIVSAGTLTPVAVTPAPAGTPQVDADTLRADAVRTFAYLEDVRAATRLPRRKGAGLLGVDTTPYAPYPAYYDLAAGAGTFAGVLASPRAPLADYTASFTSTVFGAPSYPLSTEVIASIGTFGGSVYGGIVTGQYNFANGTYSVVANTGFYGTVRAYWSVTDSGTIRPEPPTSAARSFETQPEDTADLSAWNLDTQDDYPWRRLGRAGGEIVAPAFFKPFGSDPLPTLIGQEGYVADDAGIVHGLRVLDINYATQPYQIRPVDLPEPAPALPARRALGVLANGSLTEVRLIENEVLVAASSWSAARHHDLVGWWSLTGHPDTALYINDATAYPDPVATGLLPSYRVWNATRGWGLSIPPGVNIVSAAGRDIGTQLTAGLYVEPGILQNTSEIFAKIGPVALSVGTNGFQAMALWNDGITLSTTASIPFTGSRAYVYTGLSNAQLMLGAGDPTLTPTVVTASGTFDPSTLALTALYGTEGLDYLQDFSLWAGLKSSTDLAAIRNPAFTPLATTEALPYISSVRGDRYALAIMSSGFVVPAAGTTAAQQPTTELGEGYVERYDATAQYTGDDRFKLVGLGGAQHVPSFFPLGLQGPAIDATGQMVLAGTNGILPGFSYKWTGSATVPGLLDFNAAQDRAYIQADSGSVVYEIGIDNTGAGPQFIVSLPLRTRPAAELPIVGPSLMGFEEPTDAISLLAIPGTRLSVTGAGTTGTVHSLAYAGTNTTPPLFLYNQSQVVASVVNTAGSLWVNPNPFGQALGVAALPSNGDLAFEVTAPLAVGNYSLTVDVGNIGTVDAAFAGFEVEIELQGSSGVSTVFPAVLLPNGAGANPRALTTINFQVATALSAPWVLTFTWTNEYSIPSKGQIRQLAIYDFNIRYLNPILYQVLAGAGTVSITSVGTVGIANTSLPAGGWVGVLNSYGTLVQITPEAHVYPTTMGLDTYNNSVWPLSNILTGSTFQRMDDLEVLTPHTPANAPLPVVPSLSAFSVTGAQPYTVGETVGLNVSAVGTNLGFVWSLWGAGTYSTRVPQLTTVLNYGGSCTAVVTAVDDLGQSGSIAGVLNVIAPPNLGAVVTAVNNQPFPYSTALTAFATDPAGLPLTYSWAPATISGLGSYISSYTVNGAQTVTCTVQNSAGLSATGSLPLYGPPGIPPTVSICDYPVSLRAQVPFPQTPTFAAIVGDPDSHGIAGVKFAFWDSSAITAVPTTTIAGLGSSYYAEVAPYFGIIYSAGVGLFSATATDNDGYTATATGEVELVANTAPVVQYAQPVNPGVTPGQLAYFKAYAIDAQGDTISYVWNLTSIGATYYGGNIAVDTTGLGVGASITGSLQVSDPFGGVSVTVPACVVYATALKPIGLSLSTGTYSQGVSVQIVAPDAGVTIWYTLDGTDPGFSSTAVAYGGAVNIAYQAGESVMLSARSFLSGAAPSPLASATYTFA